MRIGMEVEHWVVDSDGELVAGDDVAAACEGVEPEFVEPLVEIRTPPCDSVAELVDALVERLERARDAARERGKRLVPLGTPLSDERVARRADERTDVQRAVLGDDLAHAGHCAGAHVHFEQVAVADQLRVLTALDPAFALVATAPYYRGRRVAACARPYVYRRLCYRRLPTHGRLWRYPESADEWRERVDRRFDAFVGAARDAGVDRDAVRSSFSPADAVWSPVRLRDDLGTVEWRAPDAAPPRDLCRLVADVYRLVEAATERGTCVGTVDAGDGDDALALPDFETLCDRVDAAIARGLGDPDVERYLSRLGFDPSAYRPLGVRVDGRERLDDETARRLRTRCADALHREVRRLRERGSGDDVPTAVSA